MKRQVTVRSPQSPGAVLENLRAVAAALPPGGRLRPDHVRGVRVVLNAPRLALECVRTYRDYFGPVCVGRVVAHGGTGSSIEAEVRRSRQALFLPALAVPLIAYGWARGTPPTIGSLMVLVAGAAAVLAWTLVGSFFNTDKHEAEADALVALVRRAAEEQPGHEAVA